MLFNPESCPDFALKSLIPSFNQVKSRIPEPIANPPQGESWPYKLRDYKFSALFSVPAPFSCRSDRLTSFKSDTGTLASYNYPLPYDDKIECTWTIRVDLDYRITLSFDFFNLSQSSDCSVDYVEVRDGVFKTSDLIGKYCGTEKPESITSDSWDMRVTFKSSGKTSYPGFKASYKTKSKYERLRVTRRVCPGAGHCRPRGVPSSGFWYIKGLGNLSFWSEKDLKMLTDAFFGFKRDKKTTWFSFLFKLKDGALQ